MFSIFLLGKSNFAILFAFWYISCFFTVFVVLSVVIIWVILFSICKSVYVYCISTLFLLVSSSSFVYSTVSPLLSCCSTTICDNNLSCVLSFFVTFNTSCNFCTPVFNSGFSSSFSSVSSVFPVSVSPPSSTFLFPSLVGFSFSSKVSSFDFSFLSSLVIVFFISE